MELNNTQNDQDLLGQINFFQKDIAQNSISEGTSSQTSSSQSDSKKNEIIKLKDPIDEQYFHFKLKHLLNVPDANSFAKTTIPINMFLIDLESYLTAETKKNKELDENVAKQIFDDFKEKLANEPKIEIDSFFFNVKGKKVKDFFLNMKQYSFPANETAIDTNEDYTILVESTHCLKNTLKKKTEQLAKYYLFFSLFNQYLVEYEKYLKNFQDMFIGKYFIKPFSEIRSGDFSKYKAKISFTKKFIILIATDHTFKLFGETMDNIEKSDPQVSAEKSFSSIFAKDQKKYQNETFQTEAKNYLPKSRTAKYGNFNFLLKEINQKDNWIVKVIYFDLYFDLVVPKCVIAEGIEKFDKEIGVLKNKNNLLAETVTDLNNKNNSLAETVTDLNNKNNVLENTVSKLNKKNDILSQKMDAMLNFFEKKFGKNLLSELDQNLKEIELKNDTKKEENLKDKINHENMVEKERNKEGQHENNQ